MTPRIVTGLALAAIVTTAAAAWAWSSNHAAPGLPGAGERLLPELVDKANDVTGIAITQEGETLKLAKDGDNWRMADSGYPVDGGKLKKVIVNLARLEKMEPKTSRTDKYPLIELGDPALKDSKSRRLVLTGQAGKTLADIILGKTAWGRAGPAQSAQYVRLEGNPQSWLVKGLINARADLGDWIDTTAYKLERNDLTRMKTRHSDDGEELEIRIEGKTVAGTPKFVIAGLPASARIKDKTKLRNGLLDLARTDFSDVRKTVSGETPVTVTELETRDGLKLDLSLFAGSTKERYWLAIKVTNKGKAAETADKIAAATKGWQYGISDAKAEQFTHRLKDFLDTVEVTPQAPKPAE